MSDAFTSNERLLQVIETGTMEKILEASRRVEALGPMPPEIRESIYAVQRVQARVYPKRKAKNASHLRRINNKWKRRYGFVDKPGAFLLDASALDLMPLGLFGRLPAFPRRQILFVHPDLMALAMAAFPLETKRAGDI